MSQLWKIRRAEAIISPGATHLFGDIGGYSSGERFGFQYVSVKKIAPEVNASIRYRLTDIITARASFTVGFFHATDAGGVNRVRDYAATTSFFEPAILGEFNVIRNKMENSYLFIRRRDKQPHPLISYIDLYVFTGIGGIGYNATPNANLFPVETGRTGFVPVIPAGIGVEYNYPGNSKIGIEAGVRYAFSDELEGYAPVQSQSNDMYYFLNVTFAWKLRTRKFPGF
jgi:hypothetical protein